MKQVNIERAKSVAGILLVGVGILLLRQHLDPTVTHISHLLGNASGGMFPVVVMNKAQQTWQPNGTTFNRILQHILFQVFISVWPLLLVSIGMGLSTDFRR